MRVFFGGARAPPRARALAADDQKKAATRRQQSEGKARAKNHKISIILVHAHTQIKSNHLPKQHHTPAVATLSAPDTAAATPPSAARDDCNNA